MLSASGGWYMHPTVIQDNFLEVSLVSRLAILPHAYRPQELQVFCKELCSLYNTLLHPPSSCVCPFVHTHIQAGPLRHLKHDRWTRSQTHPRYPLDCFWQRYAVHPLSRYSRIWHWDKFKTRGKTHCFLMLVRLTKLEVLMPAVFV